MSKKDWPASKPRFVDPIVRLAQSAKRPISNSEVARWMEEAPYRRPRTGLPCPHFQSSMSTFKEYIHREAHMRYSAFGLVAALALLLMQLPSASAMTHYPQSPASSALYAKTECLSCKEKCRRCTGNGGDYATVGECYANCNSIGNPRSISTCGVRKKC
jgi:hypothetical protein